jgi:hypothetical protein
MSITSISVGLVVIIGNRRSDIQAVKTTIYG